MKLFWLTKKSNGKLSNKNNQQLYNLLNNPKSKRLSNNMNREYKGCQKEAKASYKILENSMKKS